MKRVLCAAAVVAATVPAVAQNGPAASMSQLPADVLSLACAPTVAYGQPDTPLRVTGGQDSFTRRNYAPGDLITLNAGTQNGIEVGQEYYIRRLQTVGGEQPTQKTPGTLRTAGWLRVYAVDDQMSLATIEHACDAIEVGDFLQPFALPQVPTPAKETLKPERDHYARVLNGDDRKQSFGKGDFFIIDRGSNDGVAPGARFVVYRDKHEAQNFLFELGEAVAVDVKPQTATLQVTLSRDAFTKGDYVAQRKLPADTRQQTPPAR
jgi:hypothetical protein